MHGNGTLLSIDTRTKGRGGAKQHPDFTFVHQVNHFLFDLITAGFLNETDFLGRNTIVIHQFIFDLLEDVPLVRFIGTQIAEDELCSLLLIELLIIFRNESRTMTGFVVRVITEQFLRHKTHIHRSLSTGIGGNKHLTLHLTVIKRRTENQFSVTSLGELYQSLIKVLLVCRRLNVMQDDIHIRTVKADILTSTIVGNLIIEGCQFRHLHEITKALLLYNGISNGKLIIRRFLRIDSSPCVKTVNTLLRHSLGTKVLEQ